MMPTERPLRVLHVLAGSDAGGISRYLLDLSAAMRERGHQITFAGERGAWHEQFERGGWRWVEIPLKHGIFAFRRSVRAVRELLRERPVDVIHAHYRRAALVARRVQAERGSPPLLYTLHLSHMPLSWGRRWLSDWGDHTHVASVDARQWLIDERLVPEERITVIPHGVRVEQYPVAAESDRAAARLGLGLGDEDLVAAYVGRLDYPKNEQWLLDLAEASRARLPGLKIIVAGDGPHEQQVRSEIAARGLGERVIVLGHREPLAVYQAADALLLPSLREGFSLACAEAMSVGVPVLRTRTSGSAEMIVEGVTGRTVEINRAAFVTGATEFLSDAGRLRTMGQAAAQHVRAKLTFEQQLDATTALYRRLVLSPSATPGGAEG
jgi:glycosyltransferase involved in cell wall biosynthesis